MSNLSDLLKGVSGSNSQAIELIGNSLGTLADLSGALGTITSVISLFISQDDNTQIQLKEIQDTLKKNFAELRADLRANNILNWENSFAEPVANARSALDTVLPALSTVPPVSNEFRLTQISICQAAAYQFDLDTQWKRSYLDEL